MIAAVTTRATIKQKRALGHLVENGGNVYRAMISAGYSHATAKTPQKLTESKGFLELLEESLPDNQLLKVHNRLLHTKRIDHMVFPLSITDEEITELVESVDGTMRKVIHGETAKHAYWWVPNDKARHDALKLAYDLKGKLGKREGDDGSGSTYNTFIQQNNINPNTPTARQLVDNSIDILMKQTKRKVIE